MDHHLLVSLFQSSPGLSPDSGVPRSMHQHQVYASDHVQAVLNGLQKNQPFNSGDCGKVKAQLSVDTDWHVHIRNGLAYMTMTDTKVLIVNNSVYTLGAHVSAGVMPGKSFSEKIEDVIHCL